MKTLPTFPIRPVRLTIRSSLDGCAVFLGSEFVAEFPTFAEAAAAYRAAQAAPAQVGALLARSV